MALSPADLLRHAELGLVELHAGRLRDRDISWVSSSDLPDPTPFLVPDQLLLTTGQQFGARPARDRFEEYVQNLRDHGVLGIGFGTEVVRTGTPAGLVEACRRWDMTLVEVPYGTPFLAIIRMVARELERAARERERWALGAIRAISAAAVSRGGVAAVLRELAIRLDARACWFDADGQLVDQYPASAAAGDPAIAAEVRRLLVAGDRAASEIIVGAAATSLQTVGPKGGLAGVLTVSGPRLDRAARSVSATAVALTEVAEAASHRAARTTMALHEACYRMASEGRVDLAERTAGAAGLTLPRMPATVLVAEAQSASALESSAEREARWPDRLVLRSGSRLVIVVAADDAAPVSARIAEWGHAVGTADVATLAEVGIGIARATAAGRRGAAGAVIAWESTPPPASVDDAASLAMARIAPIAVTPEGRLEIEAATAWFDENCNWGAAARRLGIHPHTVRDRVRTLAGRLSMGLDAFEDRARLWAALMAYAMARD